MPIGENQAAAAPAVKKSVPWIYYVIFFSVLNESVFNVSTPNIAGQFHLSASGVSWVVTIFFICFGMGTVVFGKLSDIFSIKKLISLGIVVYVSGSVLGFALQFWYPAVILSRAVQGVGGSAIPALVFVMVARYFTPEERGKMFGIITSTVSFAVGIGPVIGGYVAGSLHWAYLFLLPLPVLAAVPFFRRYLPNEERGAGTIDLLGAGLLGVAVSLLILYTSDVRWWLLAAAGLALLSFILRIRRAADPFLDPSLFGNPRYRSGLLISFLVFGTVMSIMFVIPLMLSKVYGLSTQGIGLIMFPGAFSAVVFGRVAGSATVKRGSHFVVYLGLAFIALSFLLQSSSVGLWVWYIGFALVLMYIGFSFVQTALTESVTQILPNHQIGVGMGLFNMVATLSGAVVTALVAKGVEMNLFAFPLNPLLSDPHADLYGSLILILAFVILMTALYYFSSFGRKAAAGRLAEELE